jgi:serine/threonine protein kinase
MGNVCCPINNLNAMKELNDNESSSDNNNIGSRSNNDSRSQTFPRNSTRKRASSYNKMHDDNNISIISDTVNILPNSQSNNQTVDKKDISNNNGNLPSKEHVIAPAAVATTVSTGNKNNRDKTNHVTTTTSTHGNELNAGDGILTRKREQSVSHLEHVGKYVILEELGHGAQATVYKCALITEYKTYMNLKYPPKTKHIKNDSKDSNKNATALSPTKSPPTCNFYAMKIVKKKSILRRRKRHRAILNSPKTHDTIKRKIGKYGYATGKIAKEIAILKRLDHENIVNVVDVLDDPDQDKLYIVMEYLPSGSLLPDWEQSNEDISGANSDIKPLSEETVRVIYRDIALAMLYMHTHNVVHRDIKPSNILMSTSNVGHGGAKLADFGVAHIFAEDDKNLEDLETFIHEPMVGTPMFRPPESFSPESKRQSVRKLSDGANSNSETDVKLNECSKGENEAERRGLRELIWKQQGLGDVWSYGVSLYLTVMGRPPFTGNTIEELSNNIRTKPVLFNFENAPVISIPLQQFLKKLLQKDISKRISSTDLMDDPWISMDGILPTLKLSRQESAPIEVEEKEINEALTLVMRTMEVVSFSTRWLMHARREVNEHHKHDEANTGESQK